MNFSWLKFWKTDPKKPEIQKITEVMMYEEEALRRLTRIARLRDELYEDFEEEAEERPDKVQKKKSGPNQPGMIHGVPMKGHGRF